MSILNSDDEHRNAMRDGGRLYVSRHRDYRMLGEKLASNYKTLLTPYAQVNE
jgi:hypothetical protein